MMGPKLTIASASSLPLLAGFGLDLPLPPDWPAWVKFVAPIVGATLAPVLLAAGRAGGVFAASFVRRLIARRRERAKLALTDGDTTNDAAAKRELDLLDAAEDAVNAATDAAKEGKE